MQRLINVGLMAIIGALLLVESANAHAAYLRSNPGAEAVIASSPPRVEIWFEQELFRRQGENTIRMSGPDGKEVGTGETAIDDDDRTHIWANLPPNLPAGKYMVEWRNVSVEDGHASNGSFTFTLDPQAAVTSTPMGEPLVSATAAQTQTLPAPSVTPTAGAQTGGPCAAGLVPLFGLVGLLFVKRLNGKQVRR